MIPAKFDYHRPGSLDEAVHVLGNAGEDAKVIAGGQSLLPLLRLRLAYPSLLVDVGRLDELRGVRDDGDSLLIGAGTTHYHLVHHPLIAEHCGLLAGGACTRAPPPGRHPGTIARGPAHSDPAAAPPPLARRPH